MSYPRKYIAKVVGKRTMKHRIIRAYKSGFSRGWVEGCNYMHEHMLKYGKEESEASDEHTE